MHSERKSVTITTNYVKPGGEAERMLIEAGFAVEFSSEVLRRASGNGVHQDVAQADAMILGTEPLTGHDLARIADLKLVARTGVGYDNVDLAKADELGIAVCNTPAANKQSVVELTLGLMLSLARDLPGNIHATARGEWNQNSGAEVAGSVLGIIGVGTIGLAVARSARALGMTVIGYDPWADYDALAAEGVEAVAFEDVLARADFVSLHIALTESAHNLIDRDAMRRMKPTAYLINTSRGGMVNEVDLVAALQAGDIAGAALDVINAEPIRTDDPLRTAPNLLLTAHIAGATVQARQRAAEVAAQQIIDFFAGRMLTHPVNHVEALT